MGEFPPSEATILKLHFHRFPFIVGSFKEFARVEIEHAGDYVLREDLDRDLTTALALAPEHLSYYGLTYEPGTELARAAGRGAGSGREGTCAR